MQATYYAYSMHRTTEEVVFTARDNTTAVQFNFKKRYCQHVSYIIVVCIATSPHMYLVLLIHFRCLILLCIDDLALS